MWPSLQLYLLRTEPPQAYVPLLSHASCLWSRPVPLHLPHWSLVLRIFWLGALDLTFSACFMQMFFIHAFQDFESAIILAMVFDHFVTISHPLHYSSILTNGVIAKIGLAIVVWAMIAPEPLPILLRRLLLLSLNVLSHSYCLHPDILEFSWSNTRINSILRLFMLFFPTQDMIFSLFFFLTCWF